MTVVHMHMCPEKKLVSPSHPKSVHWSTELVNILYMLQGPTNILKSNQSSTILVGLRTLLLREKMCPTCPFWPIFGQIKKALLFDINNIFLIKNQQLLCFEIRLIH